MDVQRIFEKNRQWIAKKIETDERYFEKLSEGQNPALLYIGCSDSRVTAEGLMGAEPGEMFVHRNIANLVPNADLNVMSVINYAVNHLKVNHIVVCGHYYCGGVKAAMGADDLGALNPWIDNIRDVYRLHEQELNEIGDEEKKYRRLVELNVQEQCVNLSNTTDVQNAQRERELKVHGWVFDIGTGKLIDLKLER